jgi:lysophospholipase L1-like esterase
MGTGAMEWRGGSVPQVAPSILSGSRPNTYVGEFVLANGILDLQKASGVCAIPGNITIGQRGDSVLRIFGEGQVSDRAVITFGGPGISQLETNGHSLHIAGIQLKTHAVMDLSSKTAAPVALQIGPDNGSWDLSKTLTIRGWAPTCHLKFTGGALPASMLARIGFDSPSGKHSGLYAAKQSSGGELQPAAEVKASAPPFDMSVAAQTRRAKLYNVEGLKELAGCGPLHQGNGTVALFGDSITWLNGYCSAIQSCLQNSGSAWKVVNHGINGGGVEQIRDGAKEAGYPGNSPQLAFAELIKNDSAETAVVFIGINDVWWRKTTPEAFEKGLRDIAASARQHNLKLVVATMELHGELPDGRNADDPKIEQFCAITRKVASDTHATLVDLRRACIAYLQNNNARLRVDGSIYSAPSGILTYDGVHPNAAGTDLLARLIADGIVRAYSP